MLAVVGNGEAEAAGEPDIFIELPELGGGCNLPPLAVPKMLHFANWPSQI
jgi:hypothetical protein